jgi:ABC-type phosphate transport system permease subunit
VIRLVLDVLNGLPSIVIGGCSSSGCSSSGTSRNGYAGAFGLAVIMLPLVAPLDAGGAAARAVDPA